MNCWIVKELPADRYPAKSHFQMAAVVAAVAAVALGGTEFNPSSPFIEGGWERELWEPF